jgi:hypothetical protein
MGTAMADAGALDSCEAQPPTAAVRIPSISSIHI